MPPSPDAVAAPAAGTALAGPVNINTAGEAELIALPGIGPALAKRIIAYREANGPFASVEDLVHIQGIGPRNINDFAGLVTV
jgi:competence protein ComEA